MTVTKLSEENPDGSLMGAVNASWSTSSQILALQTLISLLSGFVYFLGPFVFWKSLSRAPRVHTRLQTVTEKLTLPQIHYIRLTPLTIFQY